MTKASMRPRLISRGNRLAEISTERQKIASMRPRLISRGNACLAPSRRCWPWCFNEAATDQSRKWSRSRGSPTATELASMRPRLISRGNNINTEVCCGRPQSFNEAATDQSRKCPFFTGDAASTPGLQ